MAAYYKTTWTLSEAPHWSFSKRWLPAMGHTPSLRFEVNHTNIVLPVASAHRTMTTNDQNRTSNYSMTPYDAADLNKSSSSLPWRRSQDLPTDRSPKFNTTPILLPMLPSLIEHCQPPQRYCLDIGLILNYHTRSSLHHHCIAIPALPVKNLAIFTPSHRRPLSWNRIAPHSQFKPHSLRAFLIFIIALPFTKPSLNRQETKVNLQGTIDNGGRIFLLYT